jgi:2,4-dienoyl-CoA reductase-like NADH-dependent reductase (Old Yellow Enzyme family)
MPALFSPLAIRGITLPNRIAVSPMCEYSSEDGFANDWHLVHLGSRAVGGAGLVLTEAAGVEPNGRITYADLGIWKQEHVGPLRRITDFVKSQGAVPGIQLAHAGRKASTRPPWDGGAPIAPDAENGWRVDAPTAKPFTEGGPVPHEMTCADIERVVRAFAAAARLALDAGFEVIEIHGAHGYLIHQFLSPLSNARTDEFGGSFDNRARVALEIVKAVRAEIGPDVPLFLRISATDWVEGAWDADQSVELARRAAALGVDLVDVSSGGSSLTAKIPIAPAFQVPLAEKIRREAGVMTGAVGMITEPERAEEIVAGGKADLVLLAREFLRDPYFAVHAAQKLGAEVSLPKQYLRAIPGSVPRN